ncbi:MAG: 30S ribosomal protein S16 [Elusimicrobiota bacterium]
MAVKIRLKRVGSPHQAHYRVVAIESQRARDGKEVELLGHYHPRVNPPEVDLNMERVKYWLSCGAQPSPTVARLIRKIEKTVNSAKV